MTLPSDVCLGCFTASCCCDWFDQLANRYRAGVKARLAEMDVMSDLPPVRVPHPHVVVNRELFDGSPTVVGSRVPVRRLWAWHRGGMEVAAIIRRYPDLGPAKIMDALAFAYDNRALIDADLERDKDRVADGRALAEAKAELERAQERFHTLTTQSLKGKS